MACTGVLCRPGPVLASEDHQACAHVQLRLRSARPFHEINNAAVLCRLQLSLYHGQCYCTVSRFCGQ